MPMAYKPYLSIILTGIMLSPASLLAQTPAAAPSGSTNAASMWFHKLSDPFKWKEMDPIVRGNSTRLESLMRGGIIYLSLQDTIALALENNLDIELQRYGPRISESDYRRALAGGSARTVNGGVNNASTSGAVSGTGITGANLGTAQQTAITTGSVLGSLDPIFQSNLSFNHRTTPQTSLFVTGTNSLVSTSKVANFSVSQNFLTGTSAAFSLNNNFLFQNSGRNDFNPSRTVTGDLQITQHLLAGFGIAEIGRAHV